MGAITLHTALNVYNSLSEVDKLTFKEFVNKTEVTPHIAPKKNIYDKVCATLGEAFRPENKEMLVTIIMN